MCSCSFLLTSNYIIIKFGKIRKMMYNYLSIVLYLSTWIIMKPQGFKIGEVEEVSDLSQICDTIFSKIEFLGLFKYTCSFEHFAKSLRELILLTLRDITSRLGIFSMSYKSSNSFPHRLRFLILLRLSDLVLLNTSSNVRDFPFVLLLMYNKFEYYSSV